MVKPPYRRGSHGGLVYVRFISFSFFLVSGSWFLCLASEVLIVRPSNLHTDPWAGDGRNCLLPEEVHLNTFGNRGEPSRIVPEVVNESVTISLPSRKTRCTHSITSAYHLI